MVRRWRAEVPRPWAIVVADAAVRPQAASAQRLVEAVAALQEAAFSATDRLDRYSDAGPARPPPHPPVRGSLFVGAASWRRPAVHQGKKKVNAV